jgi:hypothetical protein
MQAQQAILAFSEGERSLGDRLLKIAIETDRVEGYTEPHAIAIARMAEKIGARMGLHGVDLTALKFAALAHDLGERAMKRNYLLRPSVLSWEETLDLWRHPILGEQAAGELKLSRQTQLLIRWHHEWWDGGGYPDGLAGDAIPLAARILRAVDSYFALISDRPHRQKYDLIEAEQIIADLAGIEFDPLVIRHLLQILAEEHPLEDELTSSEPDLANTGYESDSALPEEEAAMRFGASQVKESYTGYETAELERPQIEPREWPTESAAPTGQERVPPAQHYAEPLSDHSSGTKKSGGNAPPEDELPGEIPPPDPDAPEEQPTTDLPKS